jgi:5-methylcytosine-specific restriction endonuclease McrA
MFGSLHSVPPSQILSSTDSIIAQDRRLTLRLLEHLHEIDRRKLYLERGFASTFDYCTKHLRLSEPSAARRIRTARCVARFPHLYPLLESGELNLTVVSMVSRYLKSENVGAIVKSIVGKSKRDVERIIAEYEPRAALPPDRVRMVVMPVAQTSAPAAAPQFTVTGDSEKSPSSTDTRSVVGTAQVRQTAESKPVQFERVARVEFTAHEDLMAKLEQIRSLASHRLPSNAPLEQLIAFIADYFIEREDPSRRHERREARASKQEKTAGPASDRPRHVPARVHDEVFARDKQCTYVSPDGNLCGSMHVLQVDHIKPVARGGASTVDNLRLLCAYHNRLESERLMGKRDRVCGRYPGTTSNP